MSTYSLQASMRQAEAQDETQVDNALDCLEHLLDRIASLTQERDDAQRRVEELEAELAAKESA